MKKDLNYIAKVEKAMSKKFGRESIVNPKSGWDDEKEKEYLADLKEFYSEQSKQDEDKINQDGFFIPRNLINKEINRVCPVCETYSFSGRDDLYMNKFECCEKCYIRWVEDREERWINGWRPNKEQD
jgi:hypothetical protein|tara:strand:- start:376 stop:756 length:381 start_codon:yes stop_codon:yes gene_type:complete